MGNGPGSGPLSDTLDRHVQAEDPYFSLKIGHFGGWGPFWNPQADVIRTSMGLIQNTFEVGLPLQRNSGD